MANRFINQAFGQALGLGQQTVQQVKQQINQEEIRVGSHTVLTKEQIAEGGFGVVWLVTDAHTRKDLVLKRCNIERPEIYEVVRREINVLQRFASPYLVELIDSDTVQKNRTQEALLLMDYYPGGHLMGRLQQRQGVLLPMESVYRIFGQMCEALLPFHNSTTKIIHRDLKLENVLFGTDGKVRLCDFGSCLEAPILTRNAEERRLAEESILKETTQMYRAPEMVDLYMRPQLTEKTDTWALGCVLYALCYLAHPFPDGSSLSILGAKVTFPPDKPSIPADVNTLIMRMLDIDPEARPDLSTILSSIAALAAGQPLPAYELTAEAEERRKERLARDEVRESRMRAKEKKKAPLSTLPKTAVKINPNSAAAKRLAAKRGQPVAGGASSAPSSSRSDGFCAGSSSSQDDTAAFEPFSAFGDGDGDDAAAATSGKFASFDQPESASGKNASNEHFGVGLEHQTSNGSGGFDPFPASDAADSPDPFDNSFGSRPQSGAFSAFEQNTSGSEKLSRPQSGAFSNVTDASFGSDRVSPPSSERSMQQPFGGFDAFDDSSARSGVAASAFAGFDDDALGPIPPASGADTGASFDPFAPSIADEYHDSGAVESPMKGRSAAASLFGEVDAPPAAGGYPAKPPPPVLLATAPGAAVPANKSRTPPPKPPKRPSGLVVRESSQSHSASSTQQANASVAALESAVDSFDPFADSAVDFTQLQHRQYHSSSAPITPAANDAAAGNVDLLEQDLLSLDMPPAPVRASSDSSAPQNVRSVLDLFDNPAGDHTLAPSPGPMRAANQPMQHMGAPPHYPAAGSARGNAMGAPHMGAAPQRYGMQSMNPHAIHHHHHGTGLASSTASASFSPNNRTQQPHQQQQQQQHYAARGPMSHHANDPFSSLNQFGYGR